MPKIPPKEHQFKPGQSGNPEGARRHDPIKRRLKKLTSVELEEIINLILLTHPNELNKVTQDNPVLLKTWIASIVSKAVQKGDPSILFLLLDRLLGKVQDKVNVIAENHNINTDSQVVVYIPSNGREAESPKRE